MPMAVFALWSAPRTRSTAFFRSMVERGDMTVLHEPFCKLRDFGETDAGARTFDSPLSLLDWLRDETHGMSVCLKDHPPAAYLRVGRPCGVNAQVKVACLVAGVVAGADSIDDMGLLRHGALPGLFGGVRAPSTLGSFLRAFTWGTCCSCRWCTGRSWRSWPAAPGRAFRSRRAGTLRCAPRSPPSPEQAWTPIRYPRAIWDDQLRRWVSGA
jgi:hypothetical protein